MGKPIAPASVDGLPKRLESLAELTALEALGGFFERPAAVGARLRNRCEQHRARRHPTNLQAHGLKLSVCRRRHAEANHGAEVGPNPGAEACRGTGAGSPSGCRWLLQRRTVT